jgi:hypothetical protein
MAAAVPAIADERLLTPAEFRDRVAQAMTASTGNPATAVDDWTLSTKEADGTDLTVNIGNAYGDYRSHPEDVTAIVRRFSSLLGAGVTAANADQLVLIVRPASYLEQVVPAGGSLDKFPAAQAIAGDLAYFLAIDSPETIRLATMEDLRSWSLDEQNAWKRAQSNIKAHMGPIAFAELESEPGATLLVADSGLAPSMLAEAALCGPRSPAGFLALVMTRDTVLVGFPGDEASIRAFWNAARPLIETGEGLSSTPITCVGGNWTSAPIPR